MRETIKNLAEEVANIDYFIEWLAPCLSNESLKMLGMKKDIIKETVARLQEEVEKYEQETKKLDAESRSKRSRKVQEKEDLSEKSGDPETGKQNS